MNGLSCFITLNKYRLFKRRIRKKNRCDENQNENESVRKAVQNLMG